LRAIIPFILVLISLPLLPVARGQAKAGEIISPVQADATLTTVVAKAMYAHRDEDLHVIWVQDEESGSEVYYYKYNNESSSWLPGVALTEGADARDPAISGDYQGNLHVVWEEDGRILHRMWNVTGEIWTPATTLANDSSSPIVLCDRSPNAHVVWIQRVEPDPDAPSYLSHMYMTPQGDWTNATPISPTEAYSIEPAAALDSRNGMHVAWRMTFDPDKAHDLFYAYRQAGRDWGPFERILNGTGRSICCPAITADRDNFAHVVWVEETEEGSDIYYRRRQTGWEDPKLLIDSPGRACSPVIGADEGGNLHLVWQDTGESGDPGRADVYYQRLWPLDIWSTPQRITGADSEYPLGPAPRIEVSSRTRDLHIVWSEIRSGASRVLHSVWPGQRTSDLMRIASRARSDIAEVERQPFVSPDAKEKFEAGLASYEAGIDSLRNFDVEAAGQHFEACRQLIEEGNALETVYKENRGKTIGLTLALAGIIAAAVILVPWAILRGQEG
jgi:hypothetical protein